MFEKLRGLLRRAPGCKPPALSAQALGRMGSPILNEGVATAGEPVSAVSANTDMACLFSKTWISAKPLSRGMGVSE